MSAFLPILIPNRASAGARSRARDEGATIDGGLPLPCPYHACKILSAQGIWKEVPMCKRYPISNRYVFAKVMQDNPDLCQEMIEQILGMETRR